VVSSPHPSDSWGPRVGPPICRSAARVPPPLVSSKLGFCRCHRDHLGSAVASLGLLLHHDPCHRRAGSSVERIPPHRPRKQGRSRFPTDAALLPPPFLMAHITALTPRCGDADAGAMRLTCLYTFNAAHLPLPLPLCLTILPIVMFGARRCTSSAPQASWSPSSSSL
jgi:hypothetical protein